MTEGQTRPYILLINPNSSDATTQMMLKIAQDKAGDRLDIKAVTATRSPTMIVNEPQLLASEAQVVELALEAGPDCAGIIVSAYGDPGVNTLKSKLQIPVIGICEASMIDAAEGGRKFGVATVTPDLARAITARAEDLGLGALFTGIRCSPGEPETLANDAENLMRELAAATRVCISDDAKAVIIGGGPLGQAAEQLQGQFEVPIIAPISSAVRQMMMAVNA